MRGSEQMRPGTDVAGLWRSGFKEPEFCSHCDRN